ncbi:MAG TPA: hypothetical protein VNQ99_09200 [Xanthobacteraceae bacterium]|nr:hypothetical protein [Xanthobacteraceae bacterium]
MALPERPRSDTFGALALRLGLYVATLGGIAMAGYELAGYGLVRTGLASADAHDVSTRPAPGWIAIPQPMAAFALAVPDLPAETMTYTVMRHAAGGGRKDRLDWQTGEAPARFRIEIYRPGLEKTATAAGPAALAAGEAFRSARRRGLALAAPQRLRTKFGPMLLQHVPAGAGRRDCLAFASEAGAPDMILSGQACPEPGETITPRSLACALDRLVLLSAGNEPGIAREFAAAELRRSHHCSRGATLASAAPLRPSLPTQQAALSR